MDQLNMLDKITEKSSLPDIQEYIRKVIELRGFANESIQETMLLLLEETGELAKAIRKTSTNMGVDMNKLNRYDSAESEAADVFIVLLSVCNLLNIDLLSALKEKEAENCNRRWVKT